MNRRTKGRIQVRTRAGLSRKKVVLDGDIPDVVFDYQSTQLFHEVQQRITDEIRIVLDVYETVGENLGLGVDPSNDEKSRQTPTRRGGRIEGEDDVREILVILFRWDSFGHTNEEEVDAKRR